MRIPRPLLRFLLLALGLFLVFLIAGKGLYPPVYRATCNALLSRFGGGRIARFAPMSGDPTHQHDTRMSVGTREHGMVGGMPIDSVRLGYVPLALLAALVLATPVSLRRRAIALGIGVLAIQVYVVLSAAVALAHGYSLLAPGGEPLLAVSPFVSRLLLRLDRLLSGDMLSTYLVPVALWAVLLLRRQELALCRGAGGGASPGAGPAPRGDQGRRGRSVQGSRASTR